MPQWASFMWATERQTCIRCSSATIIQEDDGAGKGIDRWATRFYRRTGYDHPESEVWCFICSLGCKCVWPLAGVEPLTLLKLWIVILWWMETHQREPSGRASELQSFRAQSGDEILLICVCALYSHSFWFACDSLVKLKDYTPQLGAIGPPHIYNLKRPPRDSADPSGKITDKSQA